MTKGYLKDLLHLKQTVYSFKALTLLWPNTDAKTIKSRINYYIRQGDLYPLRRGLYAKDRSYNRLELATKIYLPSYISFETVLVQSGIIFQHYSQIFIASYQTKTIECDGQTYVFKQLQSTILTNNTGITIAQNYSIATPERAFLDTLYLNKGYHFDNLYILNWDKVHEILPIYKSNKRIYKRMQKLIADLYASVQREK